MFLILLITNIFNRPIINMKRNLINRVTNLYHVIYHETLVIKKKLAMYPPN